jgi:hypothetical protein
MANQSKHIGSHDSDAIKSQTLVEEAESEKYRRRTRSASPAADITMDSSINVVQSVLNKRQLQVYNRFLTVH